MSDHFLHMGVNDGQLAGRMTPQLFEVRAIAISVDAVFQYVSATDIKVGLREDNVLCYG